jgi:hypothetical protein
MITTGGKPSSRSFQDEDEAAARTLDAILQIKPFAFGPDPTGAGYERSVGEE